MLGFYDYTVILTYLSLASAGAGIFVSLSGNGHPYLGSLFLLICGLCDAFDGKVARSKKNRTEMEINYGIQIDSLADLVAFGVLPACIGAAMMRVSPLMRTIVKLIPRPWWRMSVLGVLFTILVLYILAALIRLAYFNVTEEQRQKNEGGVRKFYAGLPVTSSALIFPSVLVLNFLVPVDMTLVFFSVMVMTGLAFLSKIPVRKPGWKGILIMIGIGLMEFLLLWTGKILKYFLSR